jgi:hypothetical protein
VDVNLLVDEIRLSEQDIELTRCEESVSLCSISIKVTGGARFNSGGLRGLERGGYMRWGDQGRGGDVSWLAMTARNLFNVSFIAQVASACSLSLFSISWNRSSSMAGESTTFDDCYGGGTGGSRFISKDPSPCYASDRLDYSPTLTSVLRRECSTVRATLLT